ncbi:MAG: cytochrome c [Planctomycetota bacterium]|nr:MAG: cytochrome c [Planctomycetota bacterium]
MPVYEFYCADCHTIYRFLARRYDTAARPCCPRCARPRLERRLSVFAVARGRREPAAAGEQPEGAEALGPQERRLMEAMESLASEAEGLDEDDPRQMGRMMRRLYEASGLPLGPGMQEALRRLEAGEDPEVIEEQLGEALEAEGDPFAQLDEAGAPPAAAGPDSGAARARRARHALARLRSQLPPRVDETLYEL